MTSPIPDRVLPPIPAPTCDWRDLTWYAVTTLPRCEVRASAGLRENGFEVFMPTRREWTQRRRTGAEWVGRKRVRGDARIWQQVERPLWVGYILLGMRDGQGWLDVRETDGVRGAVSIAGVPLPLSAARVCDVYARCVEGEWDGKDPRPKRRRFVKGESIEINDGPFSGELARVRKTTTEDPKTVLAELLRGGAKVSVSVDALKLVGGEQGWVLTAASG